MTRQLGFSYGFRPLAWTTAAVCSALCIFSPNAQAKPLTNNQPFQHPERHEWKTFSQAMPQLKVGDREAMLLANAEMPWKNLEQARFDQPVQFVFLPDLNNRSVQPLLAGDSRRQEPVK